MKLPVVVLSAALSLLGETLPANTNIAVRLIHPIDSNEAKEGDTFAASVAEPIVIGGRTVIDRGADARVRLVDLQKSGKIKGRTELAVVLDSIVVRGVSTRIETGEVLKTSGSQGKNTAVKTGVGAGVGAAIGAIAGGGKGAAIGAAVGGAAGAASQIFTKGQRVKIPSETVLEFSTTRAVTLRAVTLRGAAPARRSRN
jgi:hypothetical protein